MHLALETNSTNCNSKQELQRGVLRAEPPAAGGKWGVEGGTPDAETIFTVFPKNTHF